MNEKQAKRLRKLIKYEYHGMWNTAAEDTYRHVKRNLDKTTKMSRITIGILIWVAIVGGAALWNTSVEVPEPEPVEVGSCE